MGCFLNLVLELTISIPSFVSVYQAVILGKGVEQCAGLSTKGGIGVLAKSTRAWTAQCGVQESNIADRSNFQDFDCLNGVIECQVLAFHLFAAQSINNVTPTVEHATGCIFKASLVNRSFVALD